MVVVTKYARFPIGILCGVKLNFSMVCRGESISGIGISRSG